MEYLQHVLKSLVGLACSRVDRIQLKAPQLLLDVDHPRLFHHTSSGRIPPLLASTI